MNDAFKELIRAKKVKAFIDDVGTSTGNAADRRIVDPCDETNVHAERALQEHLETLAEVLARAIDTGLKFKLSKCLLFQWSLETLGMVAGSWKIISSLNQGVCEIANDNSLGQIILSGAKEALEDFSNILKIEKKRAVFLPVSAPFHCSLMKPAAENMKTFLKQVDFQNPNLQLISNVTASPVEKTEDLRDLLYNQIFSQVRWRESMEYMIKNGIDDFIEIGPGKVLSGLVKRINNKVLSRSITKIDDIKNLQ